MGSCHTYADSQEELKEVSALKLATRLKNSMMKQEFGAFGKVSNPSIQFTLYETMLKKLKTKCALVKQGDTGVSVLEIFLLGALAKLGATVVTYPLLVVKSRLKAKQITTGDKRHHYEGTLDAILEMIRYEGFHGFYKV